MLRHHRDRAGGVNLASVCAHVLVLRVHASASGSDRPWGHRAHGRDGRLCGDGHGDAIPNHVGGRVNAFR